VISGNTARAVGSLAGSSQIPSAAKSITASWLTSVLRAGVHIRRASVRSFAVQQIDAAHGLVGRVFRVRVRYDAHEPRAPSTLIVKLPPADPELREQVFELYRREIRFYADLAPRVGLRTPQLYFERSDAKTGNAVLVLEDLSDLQRGDHFSGCSLERARLVVSQLARLHASWSRPQWRRRLSWLPDLSEDIEPGADRAFLRKVCQRCVARYGEKFPARLLDLGDRFVPRAASIRAMLTASPTTLVHGDLRLDNMFFIGSRSGTRLALIDWQLARRGPGVIDAAYFIGLNLDTNARRRIELDLLKTYHSELTKHITGYAFDQCMRDFRIAIVFMLFRLMTAAAVLDFADSRAEAFLESWIQRCDAMLTDHDAGAFV
jgi:hypothetical protein